MVYEKDSESTFVSNLVAAVPAWALGSIGTLLTLALVLKLIGIDFAGPINGISAAYTEAIVSQTQGVQAFMEATQRMEQSLDGYRQSLNELNATVSARMAEQDAKIDANTDTIREIQDVLVSHRTRIEVLEVDSHPR